MRRFLQDVAVMLAELAVPVIIVFHVFVLWEHHSRGLFAAVVITYGLIVITAVAFALRDYKNRRGSG